MLYAACWIFGSSKTEKRGEIAREEKELSGLTLREQWQASLGQQLPIRLLFRHLTPAKQIGIHPVLFSSIAVTFSILIFVWSRQRIGCDENVEVREKKEENRGEIRRDTKR